MEENGAGVLRGKAKTHLQHGRGGTEALERAEEPERLRRALLPKLCLHGAEKLRGPADDARLRIEPEIETRALKLEARELLHDERDEGRDAEEPVEAGVARHAHVDDGRDSRPERLEVLDEEGRGGAGAGELRKER